MTATDYIAVSKEFKESPTDLDKHLPRVIELIREDEGEDFMEVCKWQVRDDLFKVAKEAKNKHESAMIEICIESLKKKRKPYYDLAYNIFGEKTLVKWKGHEDAIDKMAQILEEPIEWILTEENERERRKHHPSWSDFGGSLKSAVDYLLRACSRDKITKKVCTPFARLLTACLRSGSDMHVVVGMTIAQASELTWEGSEKLIPDILEVFYHWIQRDDLDFAENRDHQSLAQAVCGHKFMEIGGSACTGYVKQIMAYCLDQEIEGEETDLSTYGEMLRNIINYFIMRNYQKNKQIKDLIPYVIKLLACDVTALETSAGHVIGTLYQNGELLAPHGDAIADAYLDKKGEGSNLGMALKGVYQYNPEVILSRMDRMFELLEDMAATEKVYLYMMLDDVAKKNPEVVAPHVDLLIADITNAATATMCFMALAEVSIHHPKKFVKHLDKVTQAWEQIPYTVASACKTIASVGRISKERADQCLKIFFRKINDIDAMWISVILMEVKRVGMAQKESLQVYRADIEKLKTCQQMGVPDMVQSLLDFLDDRSLQGLSEDVAEQREDINTLDSRVTNTENDVVRIDETVAKHGDDIQNVKNEVNEQGEKLDELKEVVDETVEKVEEIDHKTITNAPKWSRDVSKLLNPEHEHDWRFLAVRLGYSGEDIRNWALSPDPTMAILAEWYTTHKSSDATYAILSALEDMGRTDAAEIIKQSLEEAELLVPQAPTDQSDIPPAVFLSYQWDHQPEVKAIKEHLEMAGFPCWMDIGQMGGGDQLFARISQGMRSSKVVLCMVTEKYSNSENCNKEVNLANLLNKPIIPVLIDRTPWPPEGAMSMLFAQLLYIQFYNEREYARGSKFWDNAKFSELLGQISYHVSPDESMVAEEYRNWIPQIEDAPVVFKKVSEESKTLQHNVPQDSSEHPPVFISYQWDKQPEIKRLFSRLTSLGFHCWLDINQMGGGDPLYSKIDKGVRNAKVILSCVTSKYALSANCRREVSLSDALRKPIIPLLLEKMTWPPEGPMSMTFTQLLYIDLTKKTSQEKFQDEKFDELLQKIQEHAEPTIELLKNSLSQAGEVEEGSSESKDQQINADEPLETPVAEEGTSQEILSTEAFLDPQRSSLCDAPPAALEDNASGGTVDPEDNPGEPKPQIAVLHSGMKNRNEGSVESVKEEERVVQEIPKTKHSSTSEGTPSTIGDQNSDDVLYKANIGRQEASSTTSPLPPQQQQEQHQSETKNTPHRGVKKNKKSSTCIIL